jgi:hypothetical protein
LDIFYCTLTLLANECEHLAEMLGVFVVVLLDSLAEFLEAFTLAVLIKIIQTKYILPLILFLVQQLQFIDLNVDVLRNQESHFFFQAQTQVQRI